VEERQDQPGTPGVDPATEPAPVPGAPAPATPDTPAPGTSGTVVTDPAANAPSGAVISPSTTATGLEHAAGPSHDPGQDAERAGEGGGFSSARPLLMIGAAGDEVAELGWLLAGHGFENAISKGQAAAPPILDDALMRVVVDFQQKNGIDPWKAENDEGAPLLHGGLLGVVDARTWEALLGYQHKVTPAGQPAEAGA
jgi:hypothetical protein